VVEAFAFIFNSLSSKLEPNSFCHARIERLPRLSAETEEEKDTDTFTAADGYVLMGHVLAFYYLLMGKMLLPRSRFD